MKWKDLGYDELTWEAEDDIAPFQAEIHKYGVLMQKGASKALMKRKIAAGLEVKETKRRRKEFKSYKKTPKFLSGGICNVGVISDLDFWTVMESSYLQFVYRLDLSYVDKYEVEK